MENLIFLNKFLYVYKKKMTFANNGQKLDSDTNRSFLFCKCNPSLLSILSFMFPIRIDSYIPNSWENSVLVKSLVYSENKIIYPNTFTIDLPPKV